MYNDRVELECGKLYTEDEIRDFITNDRGKSIIMCNSCSMTGNVVRLAGGIFTDSGKNKLKVNDVIESYKFESDNRGSLIIPSSKSKIYFIEVEN